MMRATEAVHWRRLTSTHSFRMWGLVARFCRGFLDQFDVDGDVHIVADDHAAVIQLGVPLHAIVLPVDFRGCGSRYALISPGILHGSRESIHIQQHFLGDAVNRQVTGDAEFSRGKLLDLLRFEGHGREVGHVKEALTAQILVAVGFARVHGIDVNGHFNAGFGNVLAVEQYGSAELAESAAYRGKTQVTHGKLRRRVLRVNLPGGVRRGGGQGKCRDQASEYCDSREVPVHLIFPSFLSWSLKHEICNLNLRNRYSCLLHRISSSRSQRVLRRALAMWRSCCLCKSFIGWSSGFSKARPCGVMRVFTTRRSSFCRSRVIKPRFSMRSSSLVMSGSWVIMRSPMPRQGRPSGPAPRRMRSTLYCVPVNSAVRVSFSASRPRASAIFSRVMKIRSSMEACGRGGLSLAGTGR